MPASSAMRASRRLSGQLPDQRSATFVTARPDEQFAPNRPIFSALALYIDRRPDAVDSRADTGVVAPVCGSGRLSGAPTSCQSAGVPVCRRALLDFAPRAGGRWRAAIAASSACTGGAHESSGSFDRARLAVASAIGMAAAQERPDGFPSRPIKIVVPFPAGGPSDVLARMIGQKMTEDWGQPVLIENRAGANTVLGAQQVAKAPPDGYTLLMAIDSTLAMNQYLYRTPPYDPFTDFVPVTL